MSELGIEERVALREKETWEDSLGRTDSMNKGTEEGMCRTHNLGKRTGLGLLGLRLHDGEMW